MSRLHPKSGPAPGRLSRVAPRAAGLLAALAVLAFAAVPVRAEPAAGDFPAKLREQIQDYLQERAPEGRFEIV